MANKSKPEIFNAAVAIWSGVSALYMLAIAWLTTGPNALDSSNNTETDIFTIVIFILCLIQLLTAIINIKFSNIILRYALVFVSIFEILYLLFGYLIAFNR